VAKTHASSGSASHGGPAPAMERHGAVRHAMNAATMPQHPLAEALVQADDERPRSRTGIGGDERA